MKILSVDQIRDLDQYTIQNEPIESLELMERASQAFVDWFVTIFDSDLEVVVCCGPGNNGGDGLAIARLLHQIGYNVNVLLIGESNHTSPDFQQNLKKLPIEKITFTNVIPKCDIIIDAIFGSGLTRAPEGAFAHAIELINNSESIRVAVDIPSGLFADKNIASEVIVRADFTVSFQLPKLSFMFPQCHAYVGDWEAVDIGLSQKYIEQCNTKYFVIDHHLASSLVKQLNKFDHKGSNGHALLIAGSYGKMGAVVLAGRAAIRTGLGLITLHIPGGGNTIVQTAVPEAMTMPDANEQVISQDHTNHKYEAVGIGPGLGNNPITINAFKEILHSQSKPMVIDADALNILSENRELFHLIPEGSILTPHPKEFQRLVSGSWKSDFDRLKLQQSLAKELKCIVILKGAHTSIALPNGNAYFNTSGNPGMAKAGSGDVLTGIITSLLAQSYTSEDAALLGVFLHGVAGDLAVEQLGEISMMAGDIIDFVHEAYAQLVI